MLTSSLLAWLHTADADAACPWGYPIGDAEGSPAPTADNHPVGGMNLPQYGSHLGADFWSGGGCTDLGRTVYAVADGEIVEIVDALGSYLDVVVVRHEDVGVGTIYAMYGHVARDDGLAEGDLVTYRQPLGSIADVLAYFSPCHLHFELLDETAFSQGPFCSGCANAGYHVSPGYDQQAGVSSGVGAAGDPYIEVDDAIDGNRWYRVDEFLAARVGQDCGACGDGTCNGGESFDACPRDCDPCAWIAPDGATLDESGACFAYGGNPAYWYVQSDVGNDGNLRWTHTTDAEIADDYGVWSFAFIEAGDYQVEVWIDDSYGRSVQAAYELRHHGDASTIVLDQAAASGWATLGTFAFAAGGDQSLRLDDNTGEPYASMVPLVFDAVRLTRQGGGDEGGSEAQESSSGGSEDATGSPTDDGGIDSVGDAGSSGSPGSPGLDDGPAVPPGAARDDGMGGCACSSATGLGDTAWSLFVLATACARCRRRGAGLRA
jgi:Peptidase family M23